MGPAAAGNGDEFAALLRREAPDKKFAADVAAARDAVTWDGPAWPAG